MLIENCNPFGNEFVVNKTVVKEKGKELRIETKNNVILIGVDKRLINSNEIKKCDYLILNCDKTEVSYAELKGGDLAKAADQILATHQHLKAKLNSFNSFYGIVVISKFNENELKSTSVVKLQRVLKTKLIKSTNVYTYK